MTRVALLLAVLFLARTGAPAVLLTLAEARARALERNPDIAVEREALSVAAAAEERARGAYDPLLRLQSTWRGRTEPVNSLLSGAPVGEAAPHLDSWAQSASLARLLPWGGTLALTSQISRDHSDSFLALLAPSVSSSLGVELRQPLLRNRRIDEPRRAIRVALLDRRGSLLALERTVSETVAAVERCYFTLVAAERDRDVRRASVTLAEERIAETGAQVGAGLLAESDLAEPTAELERRRGDRIAADETLARAENAVKLLILADVSDPLWDERLVAADAPEMDAAPVDVAAALRRALERRPELGEAEARLGSEEVQREAARDRRMPQLDLVASYAGRGLAGSENPGARPFPGLEVVLPEAIRGGVGRSLATIGDGVFPDATLGLVLTLPLGNRVAVAEEEAAAASQKRAAVRLARERQRVAVEVRDAAVSVGTTVARIAAARAGLAAARLQLEVELARYQAGLSSNFMVLTRQNELARAQLQETAALVDHRRARVELARATGTLLEERGIEVEPPPAGAAGGR